MEREDFIEVEEESFGTPTPITPRPYRGAEFIIEESQSDLKRILTGYPTNRCLRANPNFP